MATANIILLGESGVGKTALLNRLETGEFRPTSQTMQPTLHFRNITLEDKPVTLTIEDTAGTELFHSVPTNYYRKAEGALLVYDVTYAESLRKLNRWLKELRNINENAVVLIVGNKNEDPAKKAVDISDVEKFARKDNLEYMEASAKSGENVEEAFLYLAKKILVRKGVLEAKSIKSAVILHTSRKPSKTEMPRERSATIEDPSIIRLGQSVNLTEKKKQKKKCC